MTNCNYLPGFLLVELSLTLMLSVSILLAFSFFIHTSLERQKHALVQLSLFNKTISSVERLIAECIVNNKKPQDYTVKKADYFFSCKITKPYADYSFYSLEVLGKEHDQEIKLILQHVFL